jgi:hypothetical protein
MRSLCRTDWLALLIGMLLWSCAGRGPPAVAPSEPGSRALRAIPDELPLHYRIQARLLPRSKSLRATLTLRWRNLSHRPQTRLLAHQYLNAFASPETLFMRSSAGRFRGEAADPAARGSIRVSAVQVDEHPARHRELNDRTVLEVLLPRPIPPGASTELALRFTATLPRVFARTGYAGEFFMVAQWYPKLGFLQRDGEWHCPPFHPNGEFFGRFARFDVTLTLPARYRVGATGRLVERQVHASNQTQTVRYVARGVHDFAFSAWPHFVEQRAKVGSVALRLLSQRNRTHQQRRMLALLHSCLERLERWLGRYPYPSLTVIDVPTAARGAMGMEYPTLFTTWLPAWAPAPVRAFAELTAHELTHQYFHGIIATNEVDEPWLDEGLTTFVSGLLLDAIYGERRSFLDLPGAALGQWDKNLLHQLESQPPLPIAQRAADFPDWKRYAASVYGRAAVLLYTIDDLIGRERMLAALGAYVRQYAFSHPTTADLERQLVSHTPRDLRTIVATLLAATLQRADRLDYRVLCDARRLVVERRGTIALPLQVYWRDARGALHTQSVPSTSSRLVIGAKGLRAAWLGPRNRLGLESTPLDNHCVTESPGLSAIASLVAQAQQLFWLLAP